MHRVLGKAIAAIGFVLLLAAVPAAWAATKAVAVNDNAYQPRTFTITVGDTVKWTDNGSNPHSVTSNSGQSESFDSSPGCSANPVTACMKKGDTFSHTFTHAGTFSYYCQIHGTPGDTTCPMCGVITVKAASASPTPKPKRTPGPTPKATAAPVATSPPPAATVAAVAATPDPGVRLPRTGFRTVAFVAAGLWLIAAGGALMLTARRSNVTS